jgi:hypothetical protein
VLTQPQQQQVLLPLIQAARQQQDELMLQIRQQRDLTLPPPEQQQQQQGQPMPPVVLQQQQPMQYNQPPGVRLPTPPPGLQQQGVGAAEADRPLKQPKLEQPAALSAAAAAMQVNSAAAAAMQVNSAASAALASAAEEARKGSRHVYSEMRPEQAVVAWGLWPRVVELQQRVLMLQQQASSAAEAHAQPQQL